ncbi:FtsK/SpoIIIE domain-containing protein [Planctomicrobium sp. SH527]|uniref:FtsK/SpoIIIE domain-containing protein n=1 Tax=Planctomicrobium sp. SH527 TaxID=3448123 RepID=UPI003F5C43B0
MTTSLNHLIATFREAIQRRQTAEATLHSLSHGQDQKELASQKQLNEIIRYRDSQIAEMTAKYEADYTTVDQDYADRIAASEDAHRRRSQEISSVANRAFTDLEKQKSDSTWVVTSVMDDTAIDSPVREYERFKTVLLKSREEVTQEQSNLNDLVSKALEERGAKRENIGKFGPPPVDRDEAAARFAKATTGTREALKLLNKLLLPQLFRGFRPIALYAVLTCVVALPVFLYADPQIAGVTGSRTETMWIVVSLILGAIGALLITLVLFTLSSMRQSDVMRQLQEKMTEVDWVHHHWMKIAKEQLAQRQKEFEAFQKLVERDRKQSLRRYEAAHQEGFQQIEQQRDKSWAEEETRYRNEQQLLQTERQGMLGQMQQAITDALQSIQQHWAGEVERLQAEVEQLSATRRRTQLEQSSRLRAEWTQATLQFEGALQSAARISRDQFPEWSSLISRSWKPPVQIPEAIRLGEFNLDLSHLEGANPEDARLALKKTQHIFPLELTFPEAASVLFASPTSAAREQAIAGLQTLMLRLLTLLPPGKIRFTIIDPVGLGESFGGFMHLTDYDEMLVTNRIWTESNQIEKRLEDLTEHMENILQKYLRNEFQTIEEYNNSAGEVAEPYHFLVISDFPAKFSEIAARRLVSVINSGPRCGVYTLMNYDPGKQLPNNFSLSDVDGRMTKFVWKESAFHAATPEVGQWPISIEEVPRPEDFTAIVKMVGEASKDARRVEVSFARITPHADEIWQGDSRSEVVIPLGRAGATKLQMMRIGKGTSQHMLVAGKTGSGKSTFLHILITNLSLYYSPDEVNFFLIDFKKGVEFKDYATRQLPHAQVIAVESDREFGVSALQRLGDILQERGELFRRHGVQDIAGFRNTTGQVMPRIFLVIDEFQEFFVEDDKIGQNATLLLDRLVRQGRAFGIHVILGSQTLGGAYSLARSTLGQVAIRVALQCSESDAHLILSEDNSAARLLTRPGEAIYNDANGMMEGNHPFQIAWISDEQREQAMETMQGLIQQQKRTVEPAIVFEGNIPSDLRLNRRVTDLVDQYATRESAISSPTIWLGDAVEIAPATALKFHRQNGNNLLLVGQDADAAQGVMVASLISLVASLSPHQEENSLFVMDGSHVGSPEAEIWNQVANEFESDVRRVSPNEAPLLMQALTAELQKREESPQPNTPPLFLFVFNIARFRDLRKVEDDFGMSSFGMGSSEPKPAEPGKLFADLLSRGPAVGIHTIVWCDSNNNVERWFSRQTLRELEMRVAFQMNASDSSNLIDSPAASRLGTHRALLYREETGTTEKFRPYGVPALEWLQKVKRRLQNQEGGESESDLEEFTIL